MGAKAWDGRCRGGDLEESGSDCFKFLLVVKIDCSSGFTTLKYTKHLIVHLMGELFGM